MIDIQAGDVVVCVKDGWAEPVHFSPKRGDVLRVAVVRPSSSGDLIVPVYLSFVGKPLEHSWSVNGFRKIDPATEEFTSQIKAIRPIKQREDA